MEKRVRVSKKRWLLFFGILSINTVLYQNCAPGFEGSATLASSENTASHDVVPEPDGQATPTPVPTATPVGATPTPVPTATPVGATPTPVPTATPPVPTPTPVATPTSKVSVFFATGYMARTVFSCDDGVTWIHDMSANDTTRCFIGNVDCDHSPYSAYGMSLDYGGGYFYTAYGWGYNGPLRRSSDGVNWTILKNDSYAAGMAYAKNRMVTLRNEGIMSSSDYGTNLVRAALNYNGDNMMNPLVTTVGDKVFVYGRAGGNPNLAISRDGGMSFTSVAGFNGDWSGSFVEGNGVIVALAKENMAGYVARSTDDGRTWTSFRISGADKWRANIVHNGSQFVALSQSRRWISTDGLTWTSTPLVSTYWQGSMSYNPKTATYVAIHGDYGGNYAEQHAYRSKDAITWTQLDTAHFKGGHPIKKIVVGEMESSDCR